MIVTFCGHRDIIFKEKEKIRLTVYNRVEDLIKCGAREFLLGGYGGFDKMCAETVWKLKSVYPHIISVLVVPYLDRKYDNMERYDEIEFPPLEKTPLRYAIIKRNEYMIKRADVIVAYVEFGWGGAAQSLEYAKNNIKM